ncbi:N-acetylmuramoyl-L-alanine amidase [Tahibacter aquaticus]|uniref:N-acetylmuramoyl-L-alanine amidase n=2 Tax=Tahibacter aquaticus TaxID=520092 RepID=A0A4R6YMV4_9GAMM|nr:N-acetylmuramoyl-L-alanine amidase [Tahibacter aquaticus]
MLALFALAAAPAHARLARMPALAINDHPLPYVTQLESRAASSIDLVVIHCTELPDLATARRYGEQAIYASGTGNSGHYYIDYDGSVHRYVAAERIAHHTRGYNPRSIGIELSNRGRWPDWLDSRQQQMDEPYTAAQIDALLLLLQQLRHDYPSLRWIAGHEELDTTEVPASDNASLKVRRKRDPGPLFPWQRLRDSGLQRLQPAAVAP